MPRNPFLAVGYVQLALGVKREEDDRFWRERGVWSMAEKLGCIGSRSNIDTCDRQT